jgi:hypothetical protein
MISTGYTPDDMLRWLSDPDYRADYTVTIPEGPAETRCLVAVWRQAEGPAQTCLLGGQALVDVVEHAPTAWQLQSRITLTATYRNLAAAQAVSFSVDRWLTRMLRPGDVLNVQYDSQDGIGLSAVRRDHLLWAVGDIVGMPLGRNVRAWIPHDLTTQAEAVFRAVDPEYEAVEYPIGFAVGETTRILHSGRPTINGYEIYMVRGYSAGARPCVSVANTAVCPDCAASLSALLLDKEGVQLKAWPRLSGDDE